MTSTLQDGAAKIAKLEKNFRDGQRLLVVNAAHAVEDVFYQEALKGVGGAKIAGKPWRTRSSRPATNINPQSLVRYQGQLGWLEYGTKPHLLVSKRAGGSRASRQQLTPGPGMFGGRNRRRATIRTPFGFRPYAKHPGSRAKPFFKNVPAKAGPVAARQLDRSVRTAFRESGFTN